VFIDAVSHKQIQSFLKIKNYIITFCPEIYFEFSFVLLKPGIETHSSNSWDSTWQVHPPVHNSQIKRHSEGRERRFITLLGTCSEKRQSKHSAHLQPSFGNRHEL
jgi:hypothetical protein